MHVHILFNGACCNNQIKKYSSSSWAACMQRNVFFLWLLNKQTLLNIIHLFLHFETDWPGSKSTRFNGAALLPSLHNCPNAQEVLLWHGHHQQFSFLPHHPRHCHRLFIYLFTHSCTVRLQLHFAFIKQLLFANCTKASYDLFTLLLLFPTYLPPFPFTVPFHLKFSFNSSGTHGNSDSFGEKCKLKREDDPAQRSVNTPWFMWWSKNDLIKKGKYFYSERKLQHRN